ncbi:hypothetical protein [Sphingobium subterraneum]|uniref:Uncharacterized protein n=1 Tax=Sphingobium subterraneum TaxID=627688 RepID=A0A841J441_9SPHN|nr:hypothetical protein [Sphingobium subterraneum]MBB6125577.1 hypothetical protein [Sphingobium subterraneum]
MKRWFSLLMLVGALLGLIGQEAAFAHAIPVERAELVATAAPMSPECAEMMHLGKQKPQPDKPCQGMTPDCVAKMGCAVAVALVPPLPSASPTEFRPSIPRQMQVAVLVGRETSPEPHPPARLG